jgi:hypothetical protein
MKRVMTLVAASLCGGVVAYGCSSRSNQADGSDAGPDGSTADVVEEETPPAGDGGGDASASKCPVPANLSSWTPPPYVPAKFAPGACAASDITGYDAACLDASTKTQAGCMAFQTAHAACTSCINSKSTDPSWGPLIAFGQVITFNLGGCLELVAPSETTCALAQEVSAECPHAACDTVCPVPPGDPSAFTQWQDCTKTAGAGACAKYQTVANCIKTDPLAVGTLCNPPSTATTDSLFLEIVPVFCGGADGGAGDAAPD